MRIKLNIEVIVDGGGNYRLFGLGKFICPDHMLTEYDIKTCFLDTLTTAIVGYVHEDDRNLTDGAVELKKAILEAVTIDHHDGATKMKIGDRVKHRSGSTGTVTGLLENGRICVDWDDGGKGAWNPDYIEPLRGR